MLPLISARQQVLTFNLQRFDSSVLTHAPISNVNDCQCKVCQMMSTLCTGFCSSLPMFVAVVFHGEKPASTNKSFEGLPLLLATVTWGMCLMGSMLKP